MGNTNTNEAPKQTVHIKGNKPNPYDRKVSAENKVEAALQRGADGLPRYLYMEKQLQKELTGEAQEKAKRFREMNQGKSVFGTLGDLFLKPGQKAPADSRQVKLRTHKYPIVLTSAEARELVNEFKQAIESQLKEYQQIALEVDRDADEMKEIVSRQEVWVDDIRAKVSAKLNLLIEGLGLGYRDPATNKVMVGTTAITTLFARLCM